MTRGKLDFPNVNLFIGTTETVARRFHDGEFDCALLPPIEGLGAGAGDLVSPSPLKVIPGICASVEGDSWTELVISSVDLKNVSTLYADNGRGGLVSAALVLIAEARGELPSIADISEKSEAILLSGDDVFIRKPDERQRCFDLGALWRDLYDLPLVELVWIARRGAPMPELRRILSLSLQRGLSEQAEIANEYGLAHKIDPAILSDYLANKLRFKMGCAEVDSIRHFARLAGKHGLCAPDAELPFC
jgi:hypothetical protein